MLRSQLVRSRIHTPSDLSCHVEEEEEPVNSGLCPQHAQPDMVHKRLTVDDQVAVFGYRWAGKHHVHVLIRHEAARV